MVSQHDDTDIYLQSWMYTDGIDMFNYLVSYFILISLNA